VEQGGYSTFKVLHYSHPFCANRTSVGRIFALGRTV